MKKYNVEVSFGSRRTMLKVEATDEAAAKRIGEDWARRASGNTLDRDGGQIFHRMGASGRKDPAKRG